jgi:hypothetical protein
VCVVTRGQALRNTGQNDTEINSRGNSIASTSNNPCDSSGLILNENGPANTDKKVNGENSNIAKGSLAQPSNWLEIWSNEQLCEAQLEDPYLAKVIEYMKNSEDKPDKSLLKQEHSEIKTVCTMGCVRIS